jgi:hypothetical protein
MKNITFFSLATFLVLLFSTTVTYSQEIMDEQIGEPKCISGSNCNSNSIDIIGAYLGNLDGSKIEDCGDVVDEDEVWIFIDVFRNGKKHDWFAQFDFSVGG